MAEIIAIDLSLINKVLPTEMLKKILKYLDHKTLALAKETCKRWNEIINGFELLEQAMSKLILYNYQTLNSPLKYSKYDRLVLQYCSVA